MLFGLLERSLSRGQARNRHTWRRAANVVKANIVEELNGGWVAAVFSADAELKVFLRAAPFLNADFDKLANTGRIDRCEWIFAAECRDPCICPGRNPRRRGSCQDRSE